MFADIAKMAAKIALIAVVTAAVIAVFSLVQIPTPDFTQFSQAISMGKAFIAYWVPGYNVILTFGIAMLALQVAVLGARLALIAYRWIFKVNE